MNRLRDRSARIAALGRAPPTPQRRLVAAMVAGLSAFLLVLVAFRLFGGPSDSYVFQATAAGIAAAVAGATTRIGRAIAYGLIAAFAFMLALVAILFGALVGAVS